MPRGRPRQFSDRKHARRARLAAKHYARHRLEILATAAERSFRFNSKNPPIGKPNPQFAEDSPRSLGELQQPRFWWIDARGEIHAELWESAEQLIARIQKEGQCPT